MVRVVLSRSMMNLQREDSLREGWAGQGGVRRSGRGGVGSLRIMNEDSLVVKNNPKPPPLLVGFHFSFCSRCLSSILLLVSPVCPLMKEIEMRS
jgi:hypothetical protein